ncbi:hypothetical protein HDU93_002546 [Gonapodya sp. JEL0774]|nr:hypothetical protein HDU93_002546 [Gonapodya sp. JEL0774]
MAIIVDLFSSLSPLSVLFAVLALVVAVLVFASISGTLSSDQASKLAKIDPNHHLSVRVFEDGKAREVADKFDLRKLPDDFFKDPFKYYHALRTYAPIKQMPDGSYFLSRYADIVQVYNNARAFSSDKKIEFAPKRLLVGALSQRAIDAMEPGLIRRVDELLDIAEKKRNVDIIEDFASAIPIEIIGNLLDIPHSEREPLRQWSLDILGALESSLTQDQLERGEKSVKEFLEYLKGLIARRLEKPGNRDTDMLTRLMLGDSTGEKFTETELMQNCIFLLNAGHETTTNLIGNSLVMLAEWPDQKKFLLDNLNDMDVIKTAVEEFLRFESSNQLGNRRTTQEVTVGGVKMPIGTLVTIGMGAANRDPDQFPDPDVLDLQRARNKHVAFASGIHQCAGMNLARLEGRIAVQRWLKRFPNYILTSEPERNRRARFRGFGRVNCNVHAKRESLKMERTLHGLIFLAVLAVLVTPYHTVSAALSPAATKAQGVATYQQLLNFSLFFFDAQKLGTLPPDNPFSWRRSAVELDGGDSKVDLGGGYADGGTYLKCTFPLAHATTMMAWGGIEFWDGYSKAGLGDKLIAVLKWSTDYLLKASATPTLLFVQVGDLGVESGNWGNDSSIPTPRPSFAVATTNATDIVAETAAALVSAASLFRLHSSLPSNYSQALLARGLNLYAQAYNSTSRQRYQDSAPAASGTYPSSGYDDELIWATAWCTYATQVFAFNSTNTPLSNTTGNATAPVPAENLTRDLLASRTLSLYSTASWSNSTSYSPPFWDNKIPQIYVLLHRLLNITQRADEWVAPLYQTTNATARAGFFTPGGLVFWAGASDTYSSHIASEVAFLSFVLAKGMRELNRSGADAVESVGVFQLGYLLGNNPAGIPYVTGINSLSPLRASHRPSSGISSLACALNSTSPNFYQLRGALVAGPDSRDGFSDVRAAWQGGNQPTIVAQSGYTSALAYILQQPASSPNFPLLPEVSADIQLTFSDPCAPLSSSATPPPPPPPPAVDSGSNRTAIGAGVAAGVVVVVLMGVAGIIMYNRRKNIDAGESAVLGSFSNREIEVNEHGHAAEPTNHDGDGIRVSVGKPSQASKPTFTSSAAAADLAAAATSNRIVMGSIVPDTMMSTAAPAAAGSSATIVGIVVALLVMAAVAGLVALVVVKRRHDRRDREDTFDPARYGYAVSGHSSTQRRDWAQSARFPGDPRTGPPINILVSKRPTDQRREQRPFPAELTTQTRSGTSDRGPKARDMSLPPGVLSAGRRDVQESRTRLGERPPAPPPKGINVIAAEGGIMPHEVPRASNRRGSAGDTRPIGTDTVGHRKVPASRTRSDDPTLNAINSKGSVDVRGPPPSLPPLASFTSDATPAKGTLPWKTRSDPVVPTQTLTHGGGSDASTGRDVSLGPSPPETSTKTYLVTGGYEPRRIGGMRLRPGQRVVVWERYGDGYVLGRDVATGVEGVFPATCLDGFDEKADIP